MAEVVLKDLVKKFGDVVAVKDMNLTVHDREFLVLVGPSGCGKTSTLRMVAGLEEITAGEVHIGGRLVNHLPPKDRVSLRFAVVSDGHYGQPETQFDTMHDLVIRALNREHNGREIDFSFVNGDLIHDDASFLVPVKKKWDELAMPYHVSHGNHDKVSEQGWKELFGQEWHYSFRGF